MIKPLANRDEQIEFIKKTIKEKNVRFIILQIADILGSAKAWHYL